ncbi:MAG: cobalt transporter CbiM [Thermomicrobiales bacterium]
MHIPDGYLSPQTCAVFYAAAAPFWYVALQRLKRLLTSRLVPVISIFAAFSFVIMMFNLPLPGGTTGHAVGMGLGAIVLGPWGSIIAISIALILQALFFGDGGILSLGANCFNMAIVGSLVAFGLYRLFAGRAPLTSRRRVIAGALAGYAAINVAATCAALEFGMQPLLFKDASGVPLYAFYPLSVALPAMLIGHLTFAGLAEAVVTGGVVAYLQRADPGLLKLTAPGVETGVAAAPPGRGSRWRPRLIGLLILALLSPLGLLASGTAWGEWGANQVVQEQAGYQMKQLSQSNRQALAAEFDKLAGTTQDGAAAEELHAAAKDLQSGDITGASTAVQNQYTLVKAADRAQYPQIAALVSQVKEPSGMQRFSALWTAPFHGYEPGFMQNGKLGYIVSAIVGIALVGGLAFGVSRLVGRRGPEVTGD